MSEIRKQMYRQQFCGVREHLPQTVVVEVDKLILVLLHNLAVEVAEIVQHDGEDSNPPHR